MLLRCIIEDDCKRINARWASDDGVTKYISWPMDETIEVTEHIVSNGIRAYDDENCYCYMIQLLEPEEIIGMIDVVDYIDGNLKIGYALGRDSKRIKLQNGFNRPRNKILHGTEIRGR